MSTIIGSLADVGHRPGLPRGRGSLPPDEVREAQRERILRAMTAAVAELGYANVRIADVVDRARVSRQSFYAQFADKQQCFLAAHAAGVELILAELRRWAEVHADPDPRAQVRGALAAYLDLCVQEPEFARCMLVELPAVGPAGLTARRSAHDQIAELLRAWHERARAADPALPAVDGTRYAAAVGAVHELVFSAVTGAGEDPAAVQPAAVDAVFALLAIPAR